MEKGQTNASNVILHLYMHRIWGGIWKTHTAMFNKYKFNNNLFLCLNTPPFQKLFFLSLALSSLVIASIACPAWILEALPPGKLERRRCSEAGQEEKCAQQLNQSELLNLEQRTGARQSGQLSTGAQPESNHAKISGSIFKWWPSIGELGASA